jgi:hypothetical protein
MTAVRPYRFKPARRVDYDAGPFLAMHDAVQYSATAGKPQLARRLVNVYAGVTDDGPVVTGFPGFALMGSRLGSGSDRTGQRLYQFTKRNGTEYTIGVCGGRVYTFNWGSNTWTEVLNGTDFTAASITLSTTAKVYCVTMADGCIFSDGTNVPFSWDGTSHGGLTKLTNCPPLYGQPVVYYAKLFGIKAAARQTIVWSEEGTPNTGYEAGGYQNAWDLIQTETEGLYALAATNDALYYWRSDSIGAITGAVTTDFRTTGTREAVSENVGTRSPASVIVIGNRPHFVSQFGSLCVASQGSGVEEVGVGYQLTLSQTSPVYYGTIESIYEPVTEQWRVAIPGVGGTSPNASLCVHINSYHNVGIRYGHTFTTVAVVKNADGDPTVVHFGGDDAVMTNQGYAYYHGGIYGTVWNDGFSAGTQPITHIVESGYLGYDPSVDKQFERWDATLILYTAITALGVSVTTPRGTSNVQSVAGPGLVGGLWDVGLWDSMVWGESGGERHVDVGFDRNGRWAYVTVTHVGTSERMIMGGMRLTARLIDERPGIY